MTNRKRLKREPVVLAFIHPRTRHFNDFMQRGRIAFNAAERYRDQYNTVKDDPHWNYYFLALYMDAMAQSTLWYWQARNIKDRDYGPT